MYARWGSEAKKIKAMSLSAETTKLLEGFLSCTKLQPVRTEKIKLDCLEIKPLPLVRSHYPPGSIALQQ